MKSKIEQLTRQLYIVNRLKRASGYVPTEVLLDDIFRECEIRYFSFPTERKSQMRLLQRDIRSIEEMFYVTIKNKRGYGYYIHESDNFSPMDYDRFISDFDMLTAITPETNIHKYVLAERNRYIGSDNFFPLLKAIKERAKVKFNYTNIRTGVVRQHIVEPYFLKEDQMRWYLVALRGNKRCLYGIDRMSNLTILEEGFTRDESIDGSALFQNCFGIWDDPDSPVEKVILKYDALDGAFLKSVPLHHSQEIMVDNENEFRISLNIKITNDFVMALLSRSRSLEVIEPLHLRDRIRETYEHALKRNR